MRVLNERMELSAGQRVRLEGAGTLGLVVRGRVEVYIVTREEGSFRQQYLMEAGAGGAVFPSLDEFGQVDTQIYAMEDAELEIVEMAGVPAVELRRLMGAWFSELVKLPWVRLLADKGDDTLAAWKEGAVCRGETIEELLAEFEENEGIFAMLLGVRFSAEDRRFTQRVETRARHQRKIVNDAIGNLLGEETVSYESTADTRAEKLEEATFIVRRAAAALNMPTENIKLAAELTRKLDQIRLIRRLLQKANMQMRLIELVADWYRKDSGVIIGYLGEKKELTVFVPVTPSEYKAVNRANPDGIPITAEIAAQIDKSAFACYGGFPARELGVLDLLKFIFKQCWFADYRTVILISLVAGAIPLVMPVVTETIFQDIIPILDRQGLATVTQVTLVTSFTMASLSIVRTIAVMRITQKIDMSTEAALWGRLLTLPTKFFRQYTSGELASRMGGIGVVKGLVSAEFIGGIFGFIFSFWSIFLMCYYSLKLTGVAIAVWFVYAIITAFIYRRVIGFQRSLIAANNAEAGLVQQIFAGLSKFREHGAEKHAFYLWSKVFGETWKWNLKLRWQSNYNMIIGSVQPFILTMALYYIAVYGMNEVNANGQTVQGIGYAQFIAFQAAFTSFNGTLNGIIPLVGFYTAIHPLEVTKRNAGYEMAQPITLGDNVWVGANVVVLPGVKIGRNSVVGAGAVVTKDIPENSLAYGNPCKVVKSI